MPRIWIAGRELAAWQKWLLAIVAGVFGLLIAFLAGATLIFALAIAAVVVAGVWLLGILLRAFGPRRLEPPDRF